MNNNILKNNEYAKFGYGIVLDGLPDIPEFHFFRPQTRFSSNVIVIFLKSLNVSGCQKIPIFLLNSYILGPNPIFLSTSYIPVSSPIF